MYNLMEEVNVLAKKWGNSYGVILPMRVVEKERIREGTPIRLTVRVEKAMTGADLAELGRRLGIPEKLKGIDLKKEMKRIDRELWGE